MATRNENLVAKIDDAYGKIGRDQSIVDAVEKILKSFGNEAPEDLERMLMTGEPLNTLRENLSDLIEEIFNEIENDLPTQAIDDEARARVHNKIVSFSGQIYAGATISHFLLSLIKSECFANKNRISLLELRHFVRQEQEVLIDGILKAIRSTLEMSALSHHVAEKAASVSRPQESAE